jgi:hypothetical protein
VDIVVLPGLMTQSVVLNESFHSLVQVGLADRLKPIHFHEHPGPRTRPASCRQLDGRIGWFYNISWSMMSADNLSDFCYIVPENPQTVRCLDLVPKMKGKHVNANGITIDVAIVKSYIYNKYIRDNEFFVDIAWWIKSLDGYIWMEGAYSQAFV